MPHVVGFSKIYDSPRRPRLLPPVYFCSQYAYALRRRDDSSIFAWSAHTSWHNEFGYWSLLARSPTFFESTSDVCAIQQRDGNVEPTISITNRGISLKTRIHVSGVM